MDWRRQAHRTINCCARLNASASGHPVCAGNDGAGAVYAAGPAGAARTANCATIPVNGGL